MYRPAPGGAFEGLRVIDLAQVRSGPTCVKQFADFGADVIRIEPPPGSGRAELMTGPRDGADMQNLHRNKRLLTQGSCNLVCPILWAPCVSTPVER